MTEPIDTTEVPRSTVDDQPLSPFSEDNKHKLEKALGERPDVKELVEKNILKGYGVAPALQAAQEKLQRSQLEDKLGNALAKRPKPEELVKEGILQEDEVPPSK